MSAALLDVLVCGAGPAGLLTAIHAARAGLSVEIVDPRPSPIDKACGEGLMPGAVRRLREVGVHLDGHPFAGIHYLDGRTQARAQFRHGTGLGVRRTTLQAALTSALADLGVEVEIARVDDVRQSQRSVTAAGRTARYLVAADGLHSPIRHHLGLHVASTRTPRWGQRQHFAIAPWTDLVEVHWARESEAYVTPVGPDLVGVAVLGSVRGSYPSALQAFPALLARLPAAGVSSVRGAGPLYVRSRARVAGRVLLVGDAAGYVDALTGEGIAVSAACAQALVACLVAGRPESYEQAWRKHSRRYRVITESLLWARRQPVLARAITPAAARLPAVFAALVDQLAS